MSTALPFLPEFYTLQGYDGDPIAFTWSEIQEIPYAADILDRGVNDVLPAPALAGKTLFEVQKLLRLKQEFNVCLVPTSPVLHIGSLRLVSPPVSYHVPWDMAVSCWPAEFKAALAMYTSEDLLRMIRAFDFLCMYEYRTAIVHRLLWLLHNDAVAARTIHDFLDNRDSIQKLFAKEFRDGVEVVY